MDPAVFTCPMCGSINFNIVVQPDGLLAIFCLDCDADVMVMEFDEEMYEIAVDSKKEAARNKS